VRADPSAIRPDQVDVKLQQRSDGTPLPHTRPPTSLKALTFGLGRSTTSSKTTVKSHGERVFRRVSNHVFHSVEAVGHAHEGQAIGETQALANGIPRYSNRAGKKTPGRVPVGGTNPARPILDVTAHFRGPALENLAAACPEKVGCPVKSAALTQRSRGIRQIAQPATRGAARSQNAPAAVCESWRGHAA
jgi:hypothetical protein